MRDWLDPGDGDEPIDLGAKFGLVSGDGAFYPNGYFRQQLGLDFGVGLRALQVGIEVKDLFIEANRMPPRAARPHRHAWDGFEDHAGGRYQTDKSEETIEFPRPRAWRRP